MDTLEKIHEFARQKNREGIILDTNVLLLFLIGKFSVASIPTFEPTHEYSEEDFNVLLKVIKPFKKIYITPEILAELSNLSLRHLRDQKLQQYLCIVTDFLRDKNTTEEHHLDFYDWTDKTVGRLYKFGFVDMGMYEISKKMGVPILTDEIDFHGYSRENIPIIKLSIVKYQGIINR